MKRYRYEQEEYLVARQDINFFFQDVKEGRGFHAHIHTAVEVLFIQSGALKILCEEEEFTATAGSTVLIRSDTIHTGIAQPGGCVYWVLKIKPSYLYDISFRDRSGLYLLDFTLSRAGKKILWTEEESKACGISHTLQQMIREQEVETYGYDIAMKICASQILLTLLRGMQTGQPHPDEGEQTIRAIYDTMLYVSEHYKEDLSAEDCARRCFLSYSYFSRAFRKITGKTFRAYLNSVRTDHARRELVSTGNSVTRVAADCGFNNVAYFISVFRQQTGMTPLAFRKQYGKK